MRECEYERVRVRAAEEVRVCPHRVSARGEGRGELTAEMGHCVDERVNDGWMNDENE